MECSSIFILRYYSDLVLLVVAIDMVVAIILATTFMSDVYGGIFVLSPYRSYQVYRPLFVLSPYRSYQVE